MNPARIYLGYDGSEEVHWTPKIEKNPHLLIVGTSGSGKTETIKAIVYELGKQNIPSLLVDFHNDFEELGKNILDFSNTTINPLDFSGGETAEATMYKVSYILRKIFGLGVQQQGALEDAIGKSYRDKGISIKDVKHGGALPTFDDVKKNLELRMQETKEERRPVTVIETLLVRLRPLFDTGFFSEKATTPLKRIFEEVTVLKLKDLPTDEVKYAVAEFFINQIKYALYANGKKDDLVLYCMIDEAHRLMDEKSPLNDFLRESRKYGTGIVLSSQRPSDFSETMLANIGGIVAFQCRFENDARFMAKQMSLEIEDIQNLTQIGTAFVNFSSEEGCRKVKIMQLKDRLGKKSLKDFSMFSRKKKPEENLIEVKEEKGTAPDAKPVNKKNAVQQSPPPGPLEPGENFSYVVHEETHNPAKWVKRGVTRMWYGLDFISENKTFKSTVLLIFMILLYALTGIWSAPVFVIISLIFGMW